MLPYKAHELKIPILQVSKVRLREVKWFAQGYLATEVAKPRFRFGPV